ncbi:hypothetical protein L1887_15103 [Cichorium endivia]|nr:hypothetical protein L1887_15103 [Cichorium endivia]
MEKSTHTASFFVVIIVILSLVVPSKGNARSQINKLTCSQQPVKNQTEFVSYFVGSMAQIGTIVRTSLNGTAHSGTGPDSMYVLAQCYGDLTAEDCILCYAEARTVLPTCFPSNGARIYLDGCFMRNHNYSFFHEYTSPNDSVVCGNTTSKSGLFGASVKQAVGKAVMDASGNWDYFARESLVKVNESVFVMAQCWRTLSPAECRACLDNASAALSTCLPWSEGRALNTGCFMRFSDTDFLNPILVPSSSSNRGKVIVIVVSVVSCVAVFIVVLMIIGSIRKNRYIQKKRKGFYDAKKLVKMLNDSSLNFKYSTVEKATANWGECNKLGQGGFGTVYKDQSHISTAIAGTLGYMAPEYLAHGQLTEKADVYSFGVLLLEIVTGMENNKSKTTEYTDSLVSIAWKHFQKNKVEEIFDPNLLMHLYPNTNYQKDVKKVVQVGLLCTQEAPSLRPSMSVVLRMLVKDEPLPVPSNPPFIDEKTMELNDITKKLWYYNYGDDSSSIATVSHSHFFPR